MAKRKRLEVPVEPIPIGLETKSDISANRARMPIADVASEAAGFAALEEVAQEMTAAETEGRIVKRLPLDQIELHHIARDRLVLDAEEMETLQASLAERGQQTPIEVVKLGTRYGLISGLRRVMALRRLGKAEVLAFVRSPESASDAYQAMVEENEIRVGLSFYERANIACVAVEQGVYPDERAALAGLFAHASASKRSKILKFVIVRRAIGRYLKFPDAIPEKLGLALAQAIEADRQVGRRIADTLRKTPADDSAAERRVIERALTTPKTAAATTSTIAPGLKMRAEEGRVVFSGPRVDAAFLDAVQAWAKSLKS